MSRTVQQDEPLEASDHEETLGELLAARARRASESRLFGNAVFSMLTAVAIAVWRGPLWDVRVAAAVCVLAFGLWGMADRELDRVAGEPARRHLLARVTRLAAGTVGFGAAAYAMMALLGRAIGRVIS